MFCRQARALFSSRVDHELNPREETQLRQHLDSCSECATRWSSFELTVKLVHSLPQVVADPSFVGQVFDRVRGYEAGRRSLYPIHEGQRRFGAFMDFWRTLPGSLLPGRLLSHAPSRDTRYQSREPRFARVLVPVRLAGALAFGLVLGFAVAERGNLPGRLVALTTGGASSSLGPNSGASSSVVLPDRPFADLARELQESRNNELASGRENSDPRADSAASGVSPTVPGYTSGSPGAPGRVVVSRGADGRARITF